MAAMKRRSDGAEKNISKRTRVEKSALPKSNQGAVPFVQKGLESDEYSADLVDDFEDFSRDEKPGDGIGKRGVTSLTTTTNPSSAKSTTGDEILHNGNSSRESHAKQKALAQERKAIKPNADSIARSKKLWERLRRKSHVPKEERDELVKELFSIITGRVKDFVFKHDAVRVIQCALKYASSDQQKQIARELKGEYRALAESRYAKFLIAKLVIGDSVIRDMVVPEFYGHVKRLIRHPEASWIMDDIYRTIATREQKAILLREWYGPEFVIFTSSKSSPSADLTNILQQNPEKKGPIMQHLKELTNQLVQKKTTGFTMLHDALLQYFLNCKPGSPEATEFLEMLRDDEGGDCYKNLAFTKSGARLVCLALAYGNSKDRRTILKFFKTHIKLLAGDSNGHLVLLAAYDVIDDTVMSAKAIFPELLGKDPNQEQVDQELVGHIEHLTARIPLLYLMASEPPRWLLQDDDINIIKEVRGIRATTSKKESETRRTELIKVISQPLLDLVSRNAETLVHSSFGCQFVAEVLFGAIGEKTAALEALASMADSNIMETPHAGRLLKTLVQGGRFDKDTKSIILVEPPLDFHGILYSSTKGTFESRAMAWALGVNPFVVIALLEAPGFSHQAELVEVLLRHRQKLTDALSGANGEKREDGKDRVNVGAGIILEKIGGSANGHTKKAKG